MDYLHELLALGVDAVILGLCLKEYYKCKRTVNALKIAPQLTIDETLKDYVAQQKDRKVNYAVIRGTVKPIGAPMKSVMTPSVTGVLQVMRLSEHRVTRGFAGFWTEQQNIIHTSTNEIPFSVSNGPIGVEIIDGLSAEVLDLDVIYDHYEPKNLSFFDHIFGFVSGVRERGIQTTEEILRDGSFITAIGELELENDQLRLQPTRYAPMFLTTSTKTSLLRRFEQAKSSMLLTVIICGSISAVLIGFIAKKYYARRKQERIERDLKASLEAVRQKRRAAARPTHIPEDQRCVVCVNNPKEVICLPCGHVCLCEDCSSKIRLTCPVCRAKIENKAAAFI